MSSVRFTPAAQADLEGIWEYTVDVWGLAQAERYVDDIQAACEGLVRRDRIGRRVEVREGYLKYPVGRHLVFYRMRGDGIEVVRVLHQRMDTERWL